MALATAVMGGAAENCSLGEGHRELRGSPGTQGQWLWGVAGGLASHQASHTPSPSWLPGVPQVAPGTSRTGTFGPSPAPWPLCSLEQWMRRPGAPSLASAPSPRAGGLWPQGSSSLPPHGRPCTCVPPSESPEWAPVAGWGSPGAETGPWHVRTERPRGQQVPRGAGPARVEAGWRELSRRWEGEWAAGLGAGRQEVVRAKSRLRGVASGWLGASGTVPSEPRDVQGWLGSCPLL